MRALRRRAAPHPRALSPRGWRRRGRARSSSAAALGQPRDARSPSGTAVVPLLASTRRAALAGVVRGADAITRSGCRDLALRRLRRRLPLAAPPSCARACTTSGARMREYHVNAAALRSLIAANPSVTFKLMLDGPGSGAFLEALKSLRTCSSSRRPRPRARRRFAICRRSSSTATCSATRCRCARTRASSRRCSSAARPSPRQRRRGRARRRRGRCRPRAVVPRVMIARASSSAAVRLHGRSRRDPAPVHELPGDPARPDATARRSRRARPVTTAEDTPRRSR